MSCIAPFATSYVGKWKKDLDKDENVCTIFMIFLKLFTLDLL